MRDHVIITIGREFGSGGHEIGTDWQSVEYSAL